MTNYFRLSYYLFSLLRRTYWPRRKLKEHQEKMLRRIIAYAYDNVPFYHRKFRDLGLNPTDLKTLDDLNKLPILRKGEIRENLNNMVSRIWGKEDLIKLATSGSTGRPLVLYVSKAEDEFRKARHLRANISCGHKPRDRWVVISLPTRFQMVRKFQNFLGVYTPKFISIFDDTSTQLSSLEKMKPEVLDGYSTSLFLIGREMEKRDVEGISPKMIFRGAELMDDYSQHFIEKIFGCPSFDQYATIEFERMAWQCPVKMGYHIDADSIIVQFVDANGEEVSEGESGEIVCTSLFNYAMPLIRYAVGDIGAATNEECSCGRTFPLMKVIEGRKDSFIALPNGRTLSPIPFICAMDLFKLFEHIDQFRIVQKKINFIEVQVKKKDETIKEQVLETELVTHLKKSLGLETSDITFEIKFVDKIPLDKSGKLTAITSELRRTLD